MRQRGQIILLLIFLIVLILAGIVGWFYFRNLKGLGGLGLDDLNLPFTNIKSDVDTTNWKKFTSTDQKISYYYPPNWYSLEGKYISQYPFNPKALSQEVANAISVVTIREQIEPSYANEDWFNKIYKADPAQSITNEFRPVAQARITKIESGRVRSGQKYVIFKNESISTRTICYVLSQPPEVFELTLQNFDSTGLDYFKKIISTVNVNKP